MVSYITITSHIFLVSLVYSIRAVDKDATNLETLRLVQILYRHGDRTPTRTYPNDPYSDVFKYWPEGIGQLTNTGKIQHYNLGKYFRKRYDGFLSRHYTPHEIYVLASDMDRCIMSADMNLAGLYEPLDSTANWNPTIRWTPVPVRTIPSKEDTILRTSKPCPKYKRLYREILESETVLKMNLENRDFVKYVLQNTGAEGNAIRDIVGIEDVLQVDRFHNYSLPGWANDTILEKFHKLAAQHFALATSTTETKRLKGGPLWKVFLKNMKNVVLKPDYSKPKVHVYSAHDSTLIRLLNTIMVFDEIMPTYAAAFILELHQQDKDYFVQMFYRNETNAAPHELKVPGCSEPCYLTKLIEVTAPVIPKDLESECEDVQMLSSPVLTKPSEGSDAMARAFLVVGGIFLTISILLYISRKKINFQLFTYRMPLTGRIRPHVYRSGYETI